MSIDSRQPNENQDLNQPGSHNPAEHSNLPAPREALPAAGQEMPDEKRKRLEELAERANAAHELAKDAALRFCRHSVEAGMALLEAQQLCPKRRWGAWLKEHFDASRRTAYRYMEQAQNVINLGGSVTDLGGDVIWIFALPGN